MPQEQWTAVDKYITELLVPGDPVLDDALRASADAGLPAINVSPTQGKLLYLLATAQGARTIFEIGTLGGYSTIWLGRSLPPDGHLITLEIDAAYAEVARTNIDRAGLTDVVDIRLGAALDTLAGLTPDCRYDLIFIDADKESLPQYYERAIELSHRGSLIIADNVVRNGEVIDDASADPKVGAVRRFYEILAADPRVDATAIQTVGVKGYDGFAIARVIVDP